MFIIIFSLFSSIRQGFRTRAALQAEILALRHQLLVLQRSTRSRKVHLTAADRLLWVWLSQLWVGWRSALVVVKPETAIAWHRRGFRLYWSWKSRHAHGRPSVSREVIDLIRKMSMANPRWGATNPRGKLEARLRAIRGHRGQVHGASSQATVADVAHIPGEPYEGSCVV